MSNDAMSGYAIKIDGQEIGVGEELIPVTSVTVEQSTRLPDVFSITVNDEGFKNFDDNFFPLGAKVEISLYGGGILGIVTTGEITAVTHDGHALTVQGFDPAHRLHRGPKTRTFIQSTDSDIATKIAREYSLTPDVESTSEVHPYVVQFSQSDYDFLKARAERIGYDFWVADEKLFFKVKPEMASDIEVTWKHDLLECKARVTNAEHASEVVVQGWDYLTKQPVEGRSAERDAGSSATVADEVASQTEQALGTVTRTLANQVLSTQTEADDMARSLSLLASGGAVTLRAVAMGTPYLKAGGKVNVKGMGARLSGEYELTEVTHTLRQYRGYYTRFVAGSKDAGGLTDLLTRRSTAAGNGAGGALPLFAKVTDNADPEGTGRVKVEFAHLTGTESTWAPVASPGAGADRGVQFLPEIGDQVVLVFEQGDPARPIVMGGIWSSEDALAAPEAAANGSVNTRMMRSREGHHLVFDDEGAGVIELALGDGSVSLHLEGSESSLTGDQKLVVSAREIEFAAEQKLSLKGMQVEIKGDTGVDIDSGTNLKLKGGVNADLEGGAMVNVKGGIIKLN